MGLFTLGVFARPAGAVSHFSRQVAQGGFYRPAPSLQSSPPGRGGHRSGVSWESGREIVREAPGEVFAYVLGAVVAGKLKWAGLDSNQRRRKASRFTVCPVWPLRNLPFRER